MPHHASRSTSPPSSAPRVRPHIPPVPGRSHFKPRFGTGLSGGGGYPEVVLTGEGVAAVALALAASSRPAFRAKPESAKLVWYETACRACNPCQSRRRSSALSRFTGGPSGRIPLPKPVV